MTTIKKSINYITGGVELVDRLEPLWNKLRLLHSSCSVYFSDAFLSVSYNDRKVSFLDENKKLFIIIAHCEGIDIGYCAASVSSNKGEIESIYIDEDYRGQKIGTELTKQSLDWIAQNGVENSELYVAVGNERALKFYEQFDFYPRTIKLVRKPK
ncbi:MAG: GNAT family N-acetyltransferase [Clostridia bacterium]|nr:GNAT family N-acetyltransferase [Clostridia bacterium]